MEIEISKILDTGHRRDKGNMKELGESIHREGLLQPLVINQSNELICGRRRFEAVKSLGWKSVEVYQINTIDDIDKLSKAIAENVMRKNLTWQEEVQAQDELEQLRIGKYGIATHGGDRKSSSPDELEKPSLKEIAKETKQSVGKLSQDIQLAKAVKEFPQLAKIKTKKGALRELKLIKKKEKIKTLKPVEGLFDVIVIDPPWEMEGEYNPKGRRGIPPYPTLTIEKIKKLKIPASENCILWLWVTNRKMKYAFEILEAWGFEERNILSWIKDTFGLGDWLRNQTEHCILAIKGKPFFDGKSTTTALYGKRTKHSQKPDEFYDLVEKTCMGNKLDYFGRKLKKGWSFFGDETS